MFGCALVCPDLDSVPLAKNEDGCRAGNSSKEGNACVRQADVAAASLLQGTSCALLAKKLSNEAKRQREG